MRLALNRYFVLIIIVCLFFLKLSSAACIGASPTWTATPDYVSVNACVKNASVGDTVNVKQFLDNGQQAPAWTQTLSITKGIILLGAGALGPQIGAGSTSTVITSGTSGYLIVYDPTNYDLNAPLRIAGFTFDLNKFGAGIDYGDHSKNFPFTLQTNARIDHNTFKNQTDETKQAIWNTGTIRGVVDNNFFDGVGYPIRSDPGIAGASWWNAWNQVGGTPFATFQFGDVNTSIYFEDNIFNMSVIYPGSTARPVTDCQGSGRYIFRYNTIYTYQDHWPLFEEHGNNGGEQYGCFGAEMYGNRVIPVNPGKTVRFMSQRGGKMLIFDNQIDFGGNDVVLREETNDSEEFTTNPFPQHISDTYYFNNRMKSDNSLFNIQETADIGTTIEPNRDYFLDAPTPFTATVGVGCGTLAARPTTCTKGVGYWATTQACTSVSATTVGAKPSVPLSGTFYKCNATNVWIPYFTPVVYPHPLINGTPVVVQPPPASVDALNITDLLDMEFGSVGQIVNYSMAQRATNGTSGVWAEGVNRNIFSELKVSTLFVRPVRGDVRLNGVVLSNNPSTKSYGKRLTLASDEEFIDYVIPAASRPLKASTGFFVYFNGSDSALNNACQSYCDLFGLTGSGGVNYLVFNVQPGGNDTTPLTFTIHTDVAPCNGGLSVMQAKGRNWYWVSMLYDYSGSKHNATMVVYDTNTTPWTASVSASCDLPTVGSGSAGLWRVSVGQFDNHGNNPSNSIEYYVDDVMLDTTGKSWPFVPNGATTNTSTSTPSHPADTTQDHSMSASEFTSYNQAYKLNLGWAGTGQAPSSTYYSRALVLFKLGGTYHYDSSKTCPLCYAAGA